VQSSLLQLLNLFDGTSDGRLRFEFNLPLQMAYFPEERLKDGFEGPSGWEGPAPGPVPLRLVLVPDKMALYPKAKFDNFLGRWGRLAGVVW